MAYNAVAQGEGELDVMSDEDSTSASPVPRHVRSPSFQPLQLEFDHFGSESLFMEHEQEPSRTRGLGNAVQSIVTRTAAQSYEVLDGDDYMQRSRGPSPLVASSSTLAANNAIDVPRARQSHHSATATSDQNRNSPPGAPRTGWKPIVRTASGRREDLRHPTPDLQSLQGAYVANVEHLEKTAEKLSMTSSIEDAIKHLHDEQKRSDSRRSSLLPSPTDPPALARHFSNPNSILEMNSAARSGGFSPGGFNMLSRHNSISTSSRGRSASKGSRFDSRPEPEREGRPLDTVTHRSVGSPHLSRSASIAEEQGDSATLTLPLVQHMDDPAPLPAARPGSLVDRPTTSASTNTYEQAQKLFNDFDGEHYKPRSRDPSESGPKREDRRLSSANRLSTALPQTYADPSTGQQMVYYPAPVPMMLNLPQKLSKGPSATARDKRRTQVLSTLPPAARKSAMWLPDVLEGVDDLDLTEDDPIQDQEYLPQHQRQSMGGRRSTTDLEHIPPQLRATTFFEPEGLKQVVEVKEESAVATLDSILDASAFAPVSAFTDHAFAGRLGAEVYGAAATRNASRPKSHAPANRDSVKSIQKRRSFSNLLFTQRASSSEMPDPPRRRSTMPVALDQVRSGESDASDRDDDEEGVDHHAEEAAAGEDDDDEDTDGEHPDDVVYHGAPTTLLAELQIRKQQQKQRTRPLTTAFPNGMHSTLLEMDAVAQIEKKTRKQRRVNLAWEDPEMVRHEESDEEDEDVPLAVLYASKTGAIQDRSRPMGLMEKRDIEDNEPLSHRRDRLLGRPRPVARASTMIGFTSPPGEEEEEEEAEAEGETLAQRVQRLKAQGGTATGLPTARPVSGDFTTELMGQFGGVVDDVKKDNKGKEREVSDALAPEEEETLGQRRKRLQAEREARSREVGAGAAAPEERPALKKTLSMADILTAHPVAGASRSSSYNLSKPAGGLLGMHERQAAQRSSTLHHMPVQQPAAGGFANGAYGGGVGGMMPHQPSPLPGLGYGTGLYGNHFAPGYRSPAVNMGGYAQQQMMMPMAMPFGNPYAATMGYGGMNTGYQNPMAASMLQMQGLGQQLNQGQIDMVERWRQSVMQ